VLRSIPRGCSWYEIKIGSIAQNIGPLFCDVTSRDKAYITLTLTCRSPPKRCWPCTFAMASKPDIGTLLKSYSTLSLTDISPDFSYYGGAESLSEGKRSPRRTVIASPTEADDGVSHPAPPQDPSDFLWLMTEEPHRTRRMQILKAHPEVGRSPLHSSLSYLL
jgi:hypothetical protein